MGIWKKLFGDSDDTVDYYVEGVELMNAGKYHEALTSFKLALRDTPSDTTVLQQMAVTYTRIGMTDEAAKTYRAVLARDEYASGAHYGLAFLLLHRGRRDEAASHLRSFLAAPPNGQEAERHVEHARRTLDEIQPEPSE
jgi:tetratricopeptide (TPR) repeat protein